MKTAGICAKLDFRHTFCEFRLRRLASLRGSRSRPCLSMLALLVFVASFLTLPLLAQKRSDGRNRNYGPFTLTLVGDNQLVTPARPRQNDPRFMALVKEIRKGDAAYANVEATFPNLSNSHPAGAPRRVIVFSKAERLKELQWMGFNLFATANNHSLDYGIQGLLDSMAVFKKDHAVFAGTGINLARARAPAYLFTPHGRVALVACASTFEPDEPAGQARPDMRGRPGISPLHYKTRLLVNAKEFAALRKINKDLKLRAVPGGSASSPTLTFAFPPNGIYPAHATFELSDKPGVVTTPDPKDVAAITHEIRDARYFADYVVVSIHAHEGIPGQAPSQAVIPAQFLVDFAHEAVDAGADVFVGSGPHLLRGIEIYKGKVIFYSLGNFITQNWMIEPVPSTMYNLAGLGPNAFPSDLYNKMSDYGRKEEPAYPLFWQTAVARVVFQNRRPVKVILTPVTLGFGEQSADLGWPEIAEGPEATRILEHLQKLSTPYGTKIVIRNGIGTITIPH